KELQLISLDSLVMFDLNGIIVDVNEATVEATGNSREELIRTPFADYFTDSKRAQKGVNLVFETGEVRDYELIMKTKDGTEIIVSYNASVYKDQSGKIIGAFAAARDITERKRSDVKIHNLQRYNRGLIETSLDPLVTFDQNGIIMDVNEATIKATGRSREELIGTPFADYFTDPEKAQKGVNLVFGIGEFWNYELVMKAKDGTEIIVAYNASVYKDETEQIVGAFAAARDITERKNAEIALSESKAELDLIFRIAADAMCVIDADFNIIKVNKTFIRLVGMNEDKIIGKKCYDIFSGEFCHTKDCPLEMIKKGKEFVERESVKKLQNGKEIPIILNAARFDRDDEFLGIVEDFKDITGLKRAKKEIQDLQRYYRGLIEINLDPLVTFDKKGIILDVNEATIKATGRTREELIGTLFADYFTDPKNANKAVELVFENKEIRDYELIIKARDGTKTTVAYNASVYKDEAGEIVGVFAAARDITERKRSKQELQDTIKRLEAYTGRVNSLMVTILEEISDVKTKAIILDITGIEQDIETLNPLINIARYAKLLDATCIITGIKPETVQRLSGLGVVLDPVTAERSLEEGLRYTILITEENNDNR
ncbi:MAG: PAS domain S-box protein, partial [Candidatus Methanomarinus sp.]